MKRILFSGLMVLLTILLAMALVGCGSKASSTDATNKSGGAPAQQNGPVTSNSVETPIAP